MNKREIVQSTGTNTIIDNDYKGWAEVAPRVGKSKIVIDAIMNKSEWNIVVSSPFDNIRENWEKEFEKWGLGFKVQSICSRSLENIPEGLDLLVIDELQTTSTNQLAIIKSKKPKRILGLTGYLSEDSKLLFNYQLGLSSIFQYTLEEAITDGIISNFTITVINCSLDNIKYVMPAGTKKAPFKTTERKGYDYLTEKFEYFRLIQGLDYAKNKSIKESFSRKRVDLIYTAPSKIEVAKRIIDGITERCLNFTTRTEVADILTEHSYHSKHPKGTKKNPIKSNLDKFVDEEIDKLTVCQMVSMGITLPNVKHSVIHQIQSNSEMSIQKILRICNVEEEEKEAKIWITSFRGTIDEIWTVGALDSIPADKIKYVDLKDI